MKLLHKYHKQDFDKKTLTLYENINKTYQLKYPTNLKYTLKLSMIKHSILQKKHLKKPLSALEIITWTCGTILISLNAIDYSKWIS